MLSLHARPDRGNMTYRLIATAAAASLFTMTSGLAHAAMPDSVRGMIATTMANGSKEEVDTVVKFAKQSNPEDAAEIDKMYDGYKADQAKRDAEAAKAKEEELRTAGLFENWKGEGEIGAFLTTGNTDASGFAAGLKLHRDGIKWRHNVFVAADYQRTNGVTSREYISAGYKADWKINQRLYVYGIGQYERDPIAGYTRRLTAGTGVGYRMIDRPNMTLDLEAGPSWRQTRYVGGLSESKIAARGAVNFGWQVTPNMRFGENASVYIQSGSSTYNSLTGLDFKVSDRLSARISYLLQHESDPLPGRKSTDGTARFTVVYGF